MRCQLLFWLFLFPTFVEKAVLQNARAAARVSHWDLQVRTSGGVIDPAHQEKARYYGDDEDYYVPKLKRVRTPDEPVQTPEPVQTTKPVQTLGSVQTPEPVQTTFEPTILNFDWRDKGIVTNVKNQKKCHNADWAFSAIGALEGQLMKKNKISIELSAQELIDCSKKDGNDGCEGGSVQKAFDYIMDNGISTEKTYPYSGTESDTCLNKSGEKIAKSYYIRSEVIDSTNNSESKMKETLKKHGPILAIIDGSLDSFKNYKGGIYQDEKCAKSGKHNVLIVGYDETKQKEKYWIVRNSWGEDWGEKGYFRIAREKNNTCGIASNATYIALLRRAQILISLF